MVVYFPSSSRWAPRRFAVVLTVLTLLIASAIDQAEALRGPFREFQQFIGGARLDRTDNIRPIRTETVSDMQFMVEDGDLDERLDWRRNDRKLGTGVMQSAFATELQMTDVAIVADTYQNPVPEIAPLATPTPGSYLLFGFGVVALVRRALRGKLSSRR